MKKRALIVNVYAGPGAGKSTTAAGVFYRLKDKGINCELVTEYAKRKVWEESFTTLDDQIYVFGKQQHALFTVSDKVDVIITDAPLLLSLIYGAENTPDSFKTLVKQVNDSYINLNYFIKRVKKYNPAGRMQTEDGAKAIDSDTLLMLEENQVPFKVVLGNPTGVDEITNDILEILEDVSKVINKG